MSTLSQMKAPDLIAQTEPLIKNKQYSQAIKIYRKHIEKNIND